MLSDLAPQERADPVRPACAPFDLRTLERRRRDYLGRLSDLADALTWPIVGGVAAWLCACRLTRLMHWLKTTDEPLVVVAEPQPPRSSLSALVS